jgi:hypothetical protein
MTVASIHLWKAYHWRQNARHLQKITSGNLGPKGLEDSAQGFNPGNRHPERCALTRHMNVRSMNNTRSSGLEMLKGRQIELTNNAAVKSNCHTSQLRPLIFRSNSCELYQVSLSPLQGELFILRVPRVETLNAVHRLSAALLSAEVVRPNL